MMNNKFTAILWGVLALFHFYAGFTTQDSAHLTIGILCSCIASKDIIILDMKQQIEQLKNRRNK